jgi:hypothetical protein
VAPEEPVRSVLLASVTVCAVLASACTAGRASFALVQAQQSVRQAQAAGAEEHAPYEITMAEAYLAKAREEASFSSYKTSVELARESATWADMAIIGMEREGRGGPHAGDAAAAPGAPGGSQAAEPPPEPPVVPVPPEPAQPEPAQPKVKIIEVPPSPEGDE